MDAGRRRSHRPGLPGRDARLCPLPRSHVRPDPPEGLLPACARSLSRIRSGSTACPASSTPPRTASPAPTTRSSTPRRCCSSAATTATRPAIRCRPAFPSSLGVAFRTSSRWLCRCAAVAPDRRAFVIRDQLAARPSSGRQGAKSRSTNSSKTSKDAEDIEIGAARARSRPRAQLAAQIAVERAETLVEQGQKGSKEWTDAAEAATTAQRDLAVASARRDEARRAPGARGRPRRAAGRGRQGSRRRPQGAWSMPRRPLASAAEHELHAPGRGRPTRRPARGRRLAFARWITDPSNPLTARVAVNHLWGRHFGRAIVPSVNDFGRNGQRPSHPALLDWLAAEFMERGWSMKAIHRLIVTSATYRQDSTPDAADLARDPDNVFLWRWTPRRAEAEVVRDCLFAVAGSLDSTMGGPDHRPRRRSDRPAAQPLFPARRREADGVPPDLRCRRRDRVLPPQGEHPAPASAGPGQQRSVAASGPPAGPDALRASRAPIPSGFVTAAFEQVLSRPPTEAERVECLGTSAESDGQCEHRAELAGDRRASSRADPASRRESLVHVLLNHHDFVTIR